MTKFAYSILFVRDMDASVAFYRDRIGLPLRFQSPGWSEFNSGSCTLALHQAAAGSVPTVEEGKMPAGHVHPGFQVPDIDAFAAQMAAAGVRVLREVRMEDFGFRMGVWLDPDGIPVSVSEAR